MKRYFQLVLLLAPLVCLLGCQSAQEALPDLLPKIAQLEFQPTAFEAGASPGDAEGGEVYDIALEQGGASCFSYVITGDAAYILADGAWYAVQDPTPPPAGGFPAE